MLIIPVLSLFLQLAHPTSNPSLPHYVRKLVPAGGPKRSVNLTKRKPTQVGQLPEKSRRVAVDKHHSAHDRRGRQPRGQCKTLMRPHHQTKKKCYEKNISITVHIFSHETYVQQRETKSLEKKQMELHLPYNRPSHSFLTPDFELLLTPLPPLRSWPAGKAAVIPLSLARLNKRQEAHQLPHGCRSRVKSQLRRYLLQGKTS